jgi:hypothetical protein
MTDAHDPDAEQMDAELKGIQHRLKDMNAALDARKPLHEGPPAVAEGDAIEMNPLTQSDDELR